MATSNNDKDVTVTNALLEVDKICALTLIKLAKEIESYGFTATPPSPLGGALDWAARGVSGFQFPGAQTRNEIATTLMMRNAEGRPSLPTWGHIPLKGIEKDGVNIRFTKQTQLQVMDEVRKLYPGRF